MQSKILLQCNFGPNLTQLSSIDEAVSMGHAMGRGWQLQRPPECKEFFPLSLGYQWIGEKLDRFGSLVHKKFWDDS